MRDVENSNEVFSTRNRKRNSPVIVFEDSYLFACISPVCYTVVTHNQPGLNEMVNIREEEYAICQNKVINTLIKFN